MLRLAIKKLTKNSKNDIKITTTNGYDNDDLETKKFHDDMNKFLIFS